MNAVSLSPALAGAVAPLVAAGVLVTWAGHERLPTAADAPGTSVDRVVARLAAITPVIGASTARILGTRWRTWTSRRLRAGGVVRSTAAHAGLLAVAAATSVVAAVGLAPLTGPAGATLVAAVGVPAVEALVALRIRRRRAAIADAVPRLVDILGLLVRSGMPLHRALRRAASVTPGPLGEELRAVARDVDLGVPEDVALVAMASRTEVPVLLRFVTRVTRAHELGTPVSDALRGLAVEARSTATHRVRRHAARAEPRISAIVVLTIVPATLVLVVASLVLTTDGALTGLATP